MKLNLPKEWYEKMIDIERDDFYSIGPPIVKVFKVVRSVIINGVKYYISSNIDLLPEVRVEYKIGEFVYPKAVGSKLCAFDTLSSARCFEKQCRSNYHIFECDAVNVDTPKLERLMWPDLARSSIESYWKRKSTHNDYWPEGTMHCDAIKLIKEIQ